MQASQAVTEPPSDQGRPRRALPQLSAAASRGSLFIVLAALIAVFAGIDGSTFFSLSNLQVVLTTQATYGVISLAVTVALVVGEVDLSVGGVMGAVAGVMALMVSDGVPTGLALVLALLLGTAFGLVNGLLVTYGRLSSIIATLATGTISTGVGLAIVGPNTVSGLSQTFLNIFATPWGGIQTAFYILVGLTIVAIVILQRTLLGRRLFFVGQNRDAAALLGIKVRRLTIGGMAVTGLLAGFAGIMLAGQNGAANVTQTNGYLLPAFAAAFLGTSAIVPGRFNAGGTLVATYVLGAATVGLNMTGVATWSTYIFNGALLIISLGMFTVLKLRKERSAKKQSMLAAERSAAAEATGVAAGEGAEGAAAGRRSVEVVRCHVRAARRLARRARGGDPRDRRCQRLGQVDPGQDPFRCLRPGPWPDHRGNRGLGHRRRAPEPQPLRRGDRPRKRLRRQRGADALGRA